MSISFTIVAIISIIFGVLFFIVDFYQRTHPKLNVSLIAGISISYFFLVLLPEIAENIPVIPFEFTFLEYLFVLIGFVFVHISEKLILQKVESKSQRRMRKLIGKEKILKSVEENIETILSKELEKDDFDNLAVKDIAQTIADLHKGGEAFKETINRYKAKIQKNINEDLSNLRFFTNFSYHLLVGIIVVGLLDIDLSINKIPIKGILFFLFAWFRAIITNRSESHIIFTDLEIYDTYDINENVTRKYVLSLSNILGVVIGLFLDLMYFEYTELFYIFFSFTSGVILYTIVREVIPEKEKGQPIYFLVGFIGFTVVIFTINIFTSFI
jgi:zinc transporter ZupT